MGRLLQDLSAKMQHKADKPAAEPLRIAVHSTHDTGIAALAATLGVFDDKFVPPPPSAQCSELTERLRRRWPAFTSAITFELFRRSRAAASAGADADVEGTQPKYVQNVKQGVLGALGRGNASAEHCTSKCSLWAL
jgi:hypothetical protein